MGFGRGYFIAMPLIVFLCDFFWLWDFFLGTKGFNVERKFIVIFGLATLRFHQCSVGLFCQVFVCFSGIYSLVWVLPDNRKGGQNGYHPIGFIFIFGKLQLVIY